jgi:hypothetical protein
MFDHLFDKYDQILTNMQYALWIALGLGGIFALAALTFICKVAFRPFIIVLQWLFAYTPGKEPNDLVAGMSAGFRMLAWAFIIAIAVWFLYQRSYHGY